MRLSSPPASARRPARGQAGSPAAPGPRGVAAAVKATPSESEPASSDVGRRRSLLALGAGTLLALLPPRPATAALDQAPATIPLPGEGPSPYSLTLPPGWAPATGVSPGGGGGRPTLAWFPPPSSPGAPPSDGASVSLLATPLGADYTQLGSFGDAGGFGANLIASSDQSFRLRGRGGPGGKPVDPISVQTASLVDARAATAANGAQVYRIDYALKRAGEAAPRSFWTAVSIGPAPDGRGHAALYTLTAQVPAATLTPELERALIGVVDSFVPPKPLAAPYRHLAAMAGPSFVDIGANLTDPMFSGTYHGRPGAHPPDLQSVLDRAWAAGLARIVITATSLDEGRAALALARSDARLFCTAGVHPTRAGELVEGGEGYLKDLRALIAEGKAAGKCVAVGEAGLDNDRLSFCDAATQMAGFKAQLALAAEVGLPLFLHCRAAAGELQAALASAPPLPRGGVVHSFDGTAAEMEALTSLALPGPLFIGLNGCSLKTEASLGVAGRVPLGRLLLETDAPWCEPRPSHASASLLGGHAPNPGAVDKKKWRVDAPVKGRNEPAAIAAVAVAVVGARARVEGREVRGGDLEELAAATAANAAALFGF